MALYRQQWMDHLNRRSDPGDGGYVPEHHGNYLYFTEERLMPLAPGENKQFQYTVYLRRDKN
jgi:hypothetical protein